MSERRTTRQETDQLAFGHPTDLPLNMLPTEMDVAKCFLHEKHNWMVRSNTKKEPDSGVIADIVVAKVQKLYALATIPTVRKDKIKQRVLKVYDKRLSLQRIPAVRRYKDPTKPNSSELTDYFIKKKEVLKKTLLSLFEIADTENVPKIEKEFLEDQRCARHMRIDWKLDKETTKKRIEKQARNNAAFSRFEKEAAEKELRHKNESESLVTMFSDEENTTEEEENDDEFGNDLEQKSSTSKETSILVDIPMKKQKRHLADIAEAKVRNAISDRAAASIINATLRSYNIPEIIDKSKIRRVVAKNFEELSNAPTVFGGGFCYDGRKDATLMQEKIDGKYYQSTKIEEHISMVSLPEGSYLGHVTPEDGKANTVARCLLTFLRGKGILDQIQTIACDGTNVNVGAEGGINHFIELDIGRPLQWNICLLHANELPLRHLITELDGPTTGANTFAGPIGKMLPNVTDMPVVGYKRLKRSKPLAPIPKEVWKDLSTDQKYMWRVVSSLISGKFDRDLEIMKIGPCSHSRWLTTACRICRLYAATLKPSDVLATLTAYIVNSYAPMWFAVKHYESFVDGPKHLFFLMQASERIEHEPAKKIVQRCIQRNAFYAHPENVLLAQLASSDRHDRVDAVNTILDARKACNQETSVRHFRVPPLNFKTKKWQLMILWEDTDIYEPPLVRNFSNEQLRDIIATPLVLPHFKCHTQMVERMVKEVTRASRMVVGNKKRDATIKASIENRIKYPKQETKKDFLFKE